MATPLEILLDPISLIILAMFAALMLWEAMFPGRELPKIKYWKLRGLSVFAFYFFLASYLPMIWDEYLASYQLFDLNRLGTVGGAFVGVLFYQFGVYVWHRSMHNNEFLWRTFHQMHHSAELDEAEHLDCGNKKELAEKYQELQKLLPNLKVIGGYCGTDHSHVEAICKVII